MGARQVGKTSMMKSLQEKISASPNIFLTLEDPEIFSLLEESPNTLENNFNALEERIDLGNLFETMALHELMKQGNEEIFFWRTADGKEVDFVLPAEKKAIEVKWKAPKAFPKSLHFFAKEYGFDGVVVKREKFFGM